MPLRYRKVQGRQVGLYAALLGTGSITKPADVTITVDVGGANVGDTAIPIEDPGTNIPQNTVLEFTQSGGGSVIVVVTEEFTAGAAGNLLVEDYEGGEGDGITGALSAADTATWDGLRTIVASRSADFANNSQTQDLTAATFGSGTAVTISDLTITSKSPQLSVSGLFHADAGIVQDILTHADTNRHFWAKRVRPNADGIPWETIEGHAKIHQLTDTTPADGLLEFSYTIQFLSLEKDYRVLS